MNPTTAAATGSAPAAPTSLLLLLVHRFEGCGRGRTVAAVKARGGILVHRGRRASNGTATGTSTVTPTPAAIAARAVEV